MKKYIKVWFSSIIVLFIVFAVSSCNILMGSDGKDGKAYLQVSKYSAAEAWYVYIEGFPSSTYFDTYYELTKGVHQIKYSLCDSQYQYSSTLGGYYYFYYINSYSTTYSYTYDSSSGLAVGYLTAYLNEGGSVFVNTITIEVNSGTSGSLFEDGTDGEDKYYSLYLAWDSADSTISSNGIELEKTVLTGDDGSIILQFKDEIRTFTLTSPKKQAVNESELRSSLKAIQ